MKEKLAGNTIHVTGFSTLEIIIALALLSLIITSSLQTMYVAQYWVLGGEISSEALGITKNRLKNFESLAEINFYHTTSSLAYTIKPLAVTSTTSCDTSFCYYSQFMVSDISLCAKNLVATTWWRMSPRYSTSSIVLQTAVTNNKEIIALGGDCALASPGGNWLSASGTVTKIAARSQQFSTGIDILGDYIFQTASSAPQLSIYQKPSEVGTQSLLTGTSSGMGLRLNAIDVIRDMGTGRQYAYVTQHASSSQLGVIDVTDVTQPVWLTQRTLMGTDGSGSFPQGWRIFAYGQRLYVLTRETAGAELHVFDITRPAQPTEISGGVYNLNRTVNDLVVHERVINGIRQRLIILAASADLKELGIFNVTNDTIVELVSVNLPGSEDALSVSVSGDTVYLGRRATSGGPELYQFNLLSLLKGGSEPLAVSEVGADVSTIRSSGPVLYLGTNRSGAEFQVWNNRADTWDAVVANTARVFVQPVAKLAPLGLELDSKFVYAHSQSTTQPEQLVIITAP